MSQTCLLNAKNTNIEKALVSCDITTEVQLKPEDVSRPVRHASQKLLVGLIISTVVHRATAIEDRGKGGVLKLK